MHAPLHTHHHVMVVSLWTSYYDGSVNSLRLPSAFTSVVLMYSTRSGFFLIVCKIMLPKTLMKTDAMLCNISASHAYALCLPKGPIYLPLGHSPSILVNTNSVGDAHTAWGFILPHNLHHHLLISDLVLGIDCGIFWAMPYWIQDIISSLVAAPTWQHCGQSSTIP